MQNYSDTYKRIVIIVPIASTFSTAIKIKEFLTYKLKDKVILEPYINVLYISHSPSEADEKPDENNLFKIEKNFGWTKKEDKAIWIKDISDSREQKYLLELKSEWHDIKDCQLCFTQGEDFDKERPLYFTDKSSVTPTLIFGKPKAREIEFDKNEFELNPKTLKYGHLIRGRNHFHYYIRIEAFFQENVENIQSWLDTLKKKEPFKNSFDETSKVIIIAPGHYSNAGFINLVNERLFSNAANIIHHDAQNDHILNFGLLYGKELRKEDTKVVFVDDTITTGGTFRKINFFVENTVKRKSLKDKEFDATIILLDRSNQNVYNQVNTKTDNYFSFANLHLPSLKDFDGECPLDIGYKRHNELANNSFLTRMKIRFLYQKDKLEEIAIDSSSIKIKKSGHGDEKYYVRQVEAIHRIYEWSKNPDHSFDTPFETWKKSLFTNTKSPFLTEELHNNSTDKEGLSNETATLLKVLTHSPFIHYKPIKDKLFYWVLEILKKQISNIKNEIENSGLKYNSFRDLKFLIRRAGLLSINFLISKEILYFLATLYGNNGLDKLKKDYYSEINPTQQNESPTGQQEIPFEEKVKITPDQFRNVSDFHVFYTAQIKELLYLNEARSINLEKTLIELKYDGALPDSYKQLLRFIQEENGILILKFWNFIKNKFDGIAYKELLEDDKIINILKMDTVKEHYRAKTLNEFLNLQNKENKENKYLHKNIPLIIFLKLMHFFEIKRPEINITLNIKTDFIIDQLKEIICNKSGGQNGIIEKSGAFFFVRYKKNEKPFLAYNKGSSGGLNDTTLKQNNYLNEFLNPSGDNKLTKTIIEFHKKDGKWYDLYAKDQNDIEFQGGLNFIPDDYNRLLIVRFCKLKVDIECNDTKNFRERLSNEGQAIVGFYFNKQDDRITDITKTRYLLLLCSPISAFIERHHENDEFRDWIEADNIRKLALLSGHGREMLLKIAAKKEKEGISYKDIILNLEHLQMIVALDNNVLEITGHSDIKERFNKFYNVKGSPEINFDHIKRIGKMAKQIFDFEEIENPVSCKITTVFVEQNINFAFHKSLLDMMCFELLLNAKKNRWHFLDDEKISINNNWYNVLVHESTLPFEDQAVETISDSGINNIQCNQLEINISVTNNKLVLKISNTGPKVEDEQIATLNKGQNPKKNSNVAGLTLLQALLSKEGFSLGELKFEQSPLNTDVGLYKFSAILTLNAMK